MEGKNSTNEISLQEQQLPSVLKSAPAFPVQTKDTLWFTNYPLYTAGAVRRAPDNKIYMSNAYYDGMNWNYPYPDSVYNMYNMYLSVVNYPDSVGAACDFQPYSFYLGGKRTYWGLPNNPDYDLGALMGSPCDTLLSLTPALSKGEGALFVTYVHEWEKLFENAKDIKGKNAELTIYDVMGKLIYSSAGKHAPLGAGGNAGRYFTTDFDVSRLSSGMYVVNLVTEKEVLSRKVVKH